jgi:hypothetical protein
MTWLDYAATPATPAPSRGGRASGRLSAARAWDDSPMLTLALPGDGCAVAAGRPADEGREDGGPAAKRSHWDVPTPRAQAAGAAACVFPPPSPAAAASGGLWGAEDVPPPTPTPARTPSAGLAVWPEFP